MSILHNAIEPSPLAVDRLRAAGLIGVCPRTFDTHFGGLPKVKVGTRTLYLVKDLMSALESLRVDESSPKGIRTDQLNVDEIASDLHCGAKSDAEGCR